ncbi:unnamed protein product [Brachionus calyciflorus]|uniref:G-protein coupled receptors family 1 profile domain-containing protein n=1 Tax=Brachionus calyciflorus TaxID=104777 RepID=A0A813UM80_9BILA|nr:unnamed protein product [Brachionus calyciflorus]
MSNLFVSKCINITLFEIHSKSVIDFSQYDYIKQKGKTFPTYEISIKIILCLISSMASLFGNILVIYSILIKPLGKSEKYGRMNIYHHGLYSIKRGSNLKNGSPEPNKNAEANKKLEKFSYKNKTSLDMDFDYLNSSIVSRNNNFTSSINYNNSVYRIYKPYKNKPVNFFILNLCFCDLMIVLWCSWVHLVNSISENWVLGAFFCKFNTFVQVMCLIAAISTLSVISLERFKGIVCSLSRKINRKKSVQMIIFIWFFSAIAAFPILLYRKQYKRIWKNHIEIWCSDAWPPSFIFEENTKCIKSVNEPLRRIYYTFISLVLFFIPIITMLFSYCLIIRKLKNTKILSYFHENSSQKNLLNKRRQKVNLLLFGLIFSFTICWSPVQVFILYEAYKKFDGREMPTWFNWFYFLVYLLAYSNSAINPIIYTGLNKFYKKELRKIINNFVGKRRKMSNNSSNNEKQRASLVFN